MISATICPLLPSTHHLPPGAWWLQLCKSLDQIPRSIHGSIQSGEIGSVLHRESELGSIEPGLAGSVSCNAIGDILESMVGSVLESTLRAYMRAYMAASVPSSAIRRSLESTLGTVLEDCTWKRT